MSMLQGIINNLPDAIGLGLVWGIMVMGVFITFRVLDFPDMTVDGSFAMGGCISGSLIVGGVNPLISILVAILGGMAAGFVTGILHTKLKIPGILAGILSMFGLYSINLRILGRPNVGILSQETIFDQLKSFVNVQIWDRLSDTGLGKNAVFNSIKDVLYLDNRKVAIVVGLIVVIIVISALYWFFGTELGSSLRATGCNEYMVRALGVSTDMMKILGLVIANTLVALSGAVYTQYQYYSDVNMGQGAIVIGLASIVIGEVLFGHRVNFFVRLLSVVSGSVIYRIVYAIVLRLGMKSDDMKLLTALVVAIALSVPVIRGWVIGFFKKRKNNAAYGNIEPLFSRKKLAIVLAAAYVISALITVFSMTSFIKCSSCGKNISGDYIVSPVNDEVICLDCANEILDMELTYKGGLTRGMFMSVMYQAVGRPMGSNSGFRDVPYTAGYAKAITWAARKGIAIGHTSIFFEPDEPITREEMAAMIARYQNGGTEAVEPSSFVDQDVSFAEEVYKEWLSYRRWTIDNSDRNVILIVETVIAAVLAACLALIRPKKGKEVS